MTIFDRLAGHSAPALLILDCDGVLVDSEWIAERATTAELAAAGIILAPGRDGGPPAARFRGLTMNEMTARIEAESGQSLPGGFVERLRARDAVEFEKHLEAVPGTRDFVTGLDLPYCVASSGPLAKMDQTLGLCGLSDLFEGRIFSAEQVAHGKPAPDLFLFAAEKMATAPGDCLVIEDSIHGVTAARAAGMRAWGFTGGRHGDKVLAAALTEAGAERVVAGWDF
jgi:HAD superfamily hydrolase (TIGR01509 family)